LTDCNSKSSETSQPGERFAFPEFLPSLDNIRARLREGLTPEELMLVVDYKHEHWKGLKDYQYMRPKTLFIHRNFPGYLQLLLAGMRKGASKARTGMPGRKKIRSPLVDPTKQSRRVSEELTMSFLKTIQLFVPITLD
jgi:uncharacterized phage protein (TIGR02220 family)